MAKNFSTIPEELKIQILAYLDAVSLARCAMTCKSIYEILRSSSLLAYTLHLHYDGLKEVGTPPNTHFELIESLLRRRQAWYSVKWPSLTTYRTQAVQAYEFVAGAYAITDGHNLEVVPIPTSNNVNVKHRKLQKLTGLNVRDLTMDPTQDMIALLEDGDEPFSFRIHIRTISTNAAHPLAEEDILHFDTFEFIPESIIFYLEVTQNILVVVLDLNDSEDMRGERVWIWDWTTSYPIMDTFRDPLDSLPPSPNTAFRLLDSASFFVASPSDCGSIQLYELVSSYPPAKHIATLHLPPTALNTEGFDIYANAGPIEARPYSDMPFTLNDEDRLHVLTVIYRNLDTEQSYTLDVFVHQRVFTKYISLNRDHPPVDIPWEEWGPWNTRIIHPAYWLPRTCIYGQRVFCAKLFVNDGVDEFQNITKSMTDLDFSIGAILHAKGIDMSESPSPSFSESHQLGTLLPPTPIRAGQVPVFENDVETHLPCVFYERDFERTCSTYMIHAGGIVGVEHQYGPGGDFLISHVQTV